MSLVRRVFISFVKLWVLTCWIAVIAMIATWLGDNADRKQVQQRAISKIDTCKYDTRTSVIDITYTVSNVGRDEISAMVNVTYVDSKDTTTLGTDVVFAHKVQPGGTHTAQETTRIKKPRGAVVCNSTLHLL